MRIFATCLGLLALVSTLYAQPKERTADQVRKEIAEHEKKLAELKAELAKVEKVKIADELKYRSLSVGDVGYGTSLLLMEGLRNLQVNEVIDAKTAIINSLNATDKPFLLKGVDTSAWADKKTITLRMLLKVTGTQKIGSTTLYVVEPYVIGKPKE